MIIQFGSLSASAESDSGTRQLGRGKPAALLAYLAASPGRRASRERLATLLWSEGSTDQARQNLRQTLWYVRRRLGPWLLTTDDFITLIPEVESDRENFLVAVREQRLRDAVAVYAGAFIPDFAAPGAAEFEEWADLERRRLRALFTGCCDTLARQALSAGQFTSAVDLARRARDEAPLELAPWRLLLESLAAARDTVACLAEAEHLEAMLASNEMVPDDATRAALRIARATVSKASGASTRSTPNTGAPIVPSAEDDASSLAPELIGRETEFRALLERWEATKEGKGGAVLISGVAGLGKSRLLADLQSRLRASRAKATLLRAHPGDRAVGGGFLAAISEVVAQRAGARAISSDSASVLVALAPALSSVYPQARPDAATGEDAVRRRVGALLDLLRAVSEESALALFIDDLHWVDAESRRVLDAVAARLDGGRVLLVLAARPPLDVLGGFAALPRFELTRFDTARIAEFVARIGELPTDDWAMELPAQLLAATQGIPLTLIEALQRLLETGALTLEANRWTSSASGRIAETLRQGMVLESRVRSLTPGARELLLVLATAGRPLGLEQLRLGTEQVALEPEDARLVELEHRGFILRAEGSLQVSHDEIAAATLGSASAMERAEAHRTAARALLNAESSDAMLRLAAEHATHADDSQVLRDVAARWVRRRRDDGDGASAAELIRDLTPTASPAVRARLLTGVPWFDRPPRAAVRIAATLLLLVGAGLGWSRIDRRAPDDMVVYARVEGSTTRYVRIGWRQGDAWTAQEPLEATEIADADFPVPVDSLARGGVMRLPDGSGWVGSTTFADSLGDEIIAVDANRRLERLMPHPGDDGIGALSPDGKSLVFVSARWHPRTDRHNIGVYDRITRRVRRLYASEDFDTGPMWSPDGSRIAFSRKSFTEFVPVRVCVGSVDGEALRCDWPGLDRDLSTVAWLDDEHLIVQDADQELYSLSPEDGSVARLASPRVHVSPLTGTSMGWFTADPTQQGKIHLRIASLDGRLAARPVTLHGVPILAVPLAVDSRRSTPFVDRVRVVVPPEGVQLDQSHRLRLEAFDSTGTGVRAQAVRFWSLDDSIATVQNGTLRGRRIGTVRVVGTVGGWRTDTAEIRVVPNASVITLSEAWGADWADRWRPFGDPQPRRLAGEGTAGAITTNGDGSYPSGMYLRSRLANTGGVGLEFRLSMPLTDLNQWQDLEVQLRAIGDTARLAAWDHRGGTIPLSSVAHCGLNFGGEGVAQRQLVGLRAADVDVMSPTPPGLYGGAWRTVRLQLLPDGRCGLAVDGRVVAVSEAARRVSGPLMLVLSGHSVETEVRVGRLQVWSGVRGGVDWEGRP